MVADGKESEVTKYLVLFKAGGSTAEPSAEEHRAWLKWKDDVGDALVDFGAPTIAVRGGGGGDVSGYSIVQADSLDSLNAIFETNPYRQRGGTIEFHEMLEMPDL